MEGEQHTLWETFINAIREESRAAHLFRKSRLADVLDESDLPEGTSREELVDNFLLSLDEEGDIRLKRGKQDSYLYSSEYMTDSYADILTNVEEKDVAKMVSDQVRKESRLYPRPTDKRLFFQSPFNLSEQDLQLALEGMKSDEYEDIQSCTASNKAEYFFSTKYLTRDHAEHLTEWYEVEQELNP